MSGAVIKQEVESSQMQGPTSLATVKFLGCHEILKVLVVGPDFHRMGRSVTVVPWTSSHILYGLPLHQKGDVSKATC